MTPDAKPGRADLERLVDAREKLHQGGAAGVESAAQVALAGGNDRLYEEASRAFSAHEAALRAQSAAASRLLETVQRRSTTPRQAVLRVSGAPRSVVGGRFMLRNESSAATAFRFAPDFGLPATFSPSAPELGVGEACAVDVRIQLDGSFAAGESATLGVDVYAGEVPRLRLWVDIRLEAEP